MSVVDNLRPVEALYLLSWVGKEEWSDENALAAELVYLANEGYIYPVKEKEETTFKVREGWQSEAKKLREYEIKSLKGISEGYPQDALYAIRDFDFQSFMAEKGFFRTEEKYKFRWWIFKWKKTYYYPTKKYDQTIEELEELKKEIESSLNQKRLDKRLMAWSYAFPSTGLKDGFLRYAKEVSESVYEELAYVQIATAAAITAIVAASSAAAAAASAAH